MAITRISQSSVKEGLEKANNFLAGFAPLGMEYDSIATVTVGSGGASSIEFTSIPGTYQHLHLRCFGRDARTATTQVTIRYNSDAGNNYTEHQVSGTGSTVSAYGAGNTPGNNFILGGAASSGLQAGVALIDILDYASTSKYKTMRSFSGADHNGSGGVRLDSGLWMSTSAITSITLIPFAPNFAQYTTAALYGVRA